MSDCIFCKIVAGQVPSTYLYEDPDVVAFDDVNPVAPTHVLVIPKKHISTLNEASAEDEQLLGKMMMVAKKLAGEKNLSTDGYRVVTNVMAGAGQSVFHIHFHLLGGRPFNWPPG